MILRRAFWAISVAATLTVGALAAASCGSSDDAATETGVDGSSGTDGNGGGDAGAKKDGTSDGSAMTFDGGATIVEFALGDGGPLRYPVDIALGGDGNMWFTESNGASIGRITPAGIVTQFPVAGGPQSITPGSDDAVWFASQGAVGRVSFDGGIELIPTIRDGGVSTLNWIGIAEGSDSNIWVTSPYTPFSIGRVTKGGALTLFDLPDSGVANGPQWMSEGPGGVWYGAGDHLGVVSTAGAVTTVTLPGPNFGANATVTGPDGNVWFAGGGGVGRVVPGGAVTEFPTSFSAWAITVGPDANLWFTETSGGKIGRCTLTGVVTEFAVPTTSPFSSPFGIARGPANTVWFTESTADQIGEVILN